MILKTNQIVGIGPQILAAKLYDRIRHFSRSGILQSNWLHRSVTQSVPSTPGNLLNWQASFEVVELLPFVCLDGLRRNQRIVKAVIFLFAERAVDVIGRSFVVAGREVHL